MFERYTEAARKAVFFARFEASQTGSREIETEHLLLGILRELSPSLERVLGPRRKIEAIRKQIGRHFPPAPGVVYTTGDLPLTQQCRRVLENAAKEAAKLKQDQIRPEHLLLGILSEESSIAAGVLRESGIGSAQLREAAVQGGETVDVGRREPPPEVEGLRDMTVAARQGRAGPLVGRERELERILHVLSRRTKNNPVLIGEAGVGKTAIVEGLAARMAEGEVPPALEERRLLAVDASALMSSRQRSRSLEEALGALGDPANTILFVRGLFNLAAAGSAWAVVEAMRALEPLLAHDGMQCIATGSPLGLRETAAKVGMLARHFDVVPVAPVSEADAVRIVSGLKAQFERFHEVTFDEGAIEAAVYASGPFLPGRHLPDRAIDLIDEAAVAVKLRGESKLRRHARAPENAIANHEFDQLRPADTASRTVTPEDIEAAVAARSGVPVAAVKRVLEQRGTGELERIAAELASQVPDEPWVPFLAAYLARCSVEEAEALAQAIRAGCSGRKPL
jgi:ATP-dependent Clp protease ATP-binding subunit ClpC